MRRRRPDTSTSNELPDVLRTFRFGDWHDPADAVVAHPGTVNAGTPVDPVEFTAMMVKHKARRRYYEAREAWAADHGLHIRDLPYR